MCLARVSRGVKNDISSNNKSFVRWNFSHDSNRLYFVVLWMETRKTSYNARSAEWKYFMNVSSSYFPMLSDFTACCSPILKSTIVPLPLTWFRNLFVHLRSENLEWIERIVAVRALHPRSDRFALDNTAQMKWKAKSIFIYDFRVKIWIATFFSTVPMAT